MKSIKEIVSYIIENTVRLKDKYAEAKTAPIDWVAIFAQNEQEYETFVKETKKIGKVLQDTPTGPIFKLVRPIKTKAGDLRIIKIRKPDKTRPQRGDGDFRLSDYETFKKKNLADKHLKLIKRKNYEMIELKDSEFDVLVYFSNPPISKVLGLS